MKQSGLEYLIDKILYTEENYLDEYGELTDTPRVVYMNSYKSHVDLTEHVNKAREIDARRQVLIEMMASDEELGLYNEKTSQEQINSIIDVLNTQGAISEGDMPVLIENECTCDNCGKESRGSHLCPYDEEFNGGHSDSCNCCDGCRRECLMDI